MTRSRTVIMLSVAILGFVTALADSARSEELRIGFIAPLTGSFAQAGKDMINGFQLYLDRHAGNGSFGSATITFVVEDSQGDDEAAVAKAEKLVQKDKVHLFVGGALAATGSALAPVSTARKTVYVASIPAADDLTQRQADKHPYLIRTGWSSSQTMHPMGQWACEQGYGKIATIAVDDAFGYGQVGGFQKAFESCGGQIIQKIWTPTDTKDFGPYIATISEESDALLSVMVGPMARRFPRQFRRAGNKTPIIGGGTSYDEFALPFMGREVTGDVSSLQYSAALETPKNEAFVKEYRNKYDKVPSYFSESNYTTAQMIDEVMRQSGGKWPGAEKFIAMMAALKIDAVRGPVAFDGLRNPVQNVYIRRVERRRMFGSRRTELWNTVIKTYPAVSQFWTYGKEEFLKQPVYSRDFPPCSHCDARPEDVEAR